MSYQTTNDFSIQNKTTILYKTGKKKKYNDGECILPLYYKQTNQNKKANYIFL